MALIYLFIYFLLHHCHGCVWGQKASMRDKTFLRKKKKKKKKLRQFSAWIRKKKQHILNKWMHHGSIENAGEAFKMSEDMTQIIQLKISLGVLYFRDLFYFHYISIESSFPKGSFLFYFIYLFFNHYMKCSPCAIDYNLGHLFDWIQLVEMTLASKVLSQKVVFNFSGW